MPAISPMNETLYYFHDPMCSWCYAFRHSLIEIQAGLPSQMVLKKVVAGLAPDSDQPMDIQTQQYVRDNWRQIEQRVRNTRFNDDFWHHNTPIRSTYPACRAVLAAKQQDESYQDLMIAAIQQGYYQQARNPSLYSVLIEFAAEIGLNVEQFEKQIHSPLIEKQLKEEIQFSRNIGVSSFPSLVLYRNNRYINLSIDYNKTEDTLKQLL